MGYRIAGDRTLNHSRGIGWDAVHLAIDDHSRVSFARVLPDEGALSCAEFLRQAVAYYASLSVRSGPMPSPTKAQRSAKQHCSPSSIATTGIGHIPP